MTKVYEDIKTLLDCELENISKKPEISEQDLHELDKAIDILKDMYELDGMQNGGYSGARGSYGMIPYTGAIYYEDGSSYGRNGNSGRSSYGYNQGYAQGGNSGRSYANNGSSYGRYDEPRMMPRDNWM